MKILHIYKDYPPVLGGIEGHVALLARSQARLGHEVSVLVSDGGQPPGTTLEEGVRVFRSRSWATVSSTPLCPSMITKIRNISADVTHLHSPYPFGDLDKLLNAIISLEGLTDIASLLCFISFLHRLVRQRLKMGRQRLFRLDRFYVYIILWISLHLKNLSTGIDHLVYPAYVT